MRIVEIPQAKRRPKIALILQGGGALGAYHIGAYQALEEAGLQPDWVSGISIGAINSAILVGNEPHRRLERLEELWWKISRPDPWGYLLGEGWQNTSQALDKAVNSYSNASALLFGQPNFFLPRFCNPYFATPGTLGATSFYDTAPLLATLRRLASFDLINERKTRLSLGATSVTNGHMVFFDNTRQTIKPEHVLASGSLPPGFPAVQIDGDCYWDGGCISNTPLEAVLADQPTEDTIVFMIDLWSATGKVPQTMDDVMWRQKQIQYASRTAHHIDAVATKLKLRDARRKLEKAARGATDDPRKSDRDGQPEEGRLEIVHIIYHPEADQIPQSDAEFSRVSITERRAAGYRDMQQALTDIPYFESPSAGQDDAAVHKVERGAVQTKRDPNLRTTGDVSSRFVTG